MKKVFLKLLAIALVTAFARTAYQARAVTSFTEIAQALSKQIRELEAQVNQKAEALSRQVPEAAELFETTPTDIAQLRASIPSGTTVVHPVLLTNIDNVPNTIAIFVLSRDKLTVAW